VGLSTPRPIPNLEDQTSVFVNPEMVILLYPQALVPILVTFYNTSYVEIILILQSPHRKNVSIMMTSSNLSMGLLPSY
jgi:hypothetical protein